MNHSNPHWPIRVALFGWFGSRDRHLQPLRNFYEERGAAVCTFVANAGEVVRHADGYQRAAQRFVESISSADAKDPRPLVIHVFSNHGFSTTVEFLDELRSKNAAQFSRISCIVFDSAPGFPNEPSLRFTTRYFPRISMPGLLAALRLRPSTEHLIFTPILAAAAGIAHFAMQSRLRDFHATAQRMTSALSKLPHKRLLFFWGDADAIVSHEIVEAFADSCENAGFIVERRFFPGSRHVRHLLEHRVQYLETLTHFITACNESN